MDRVRTLTPRRGPSGLLTAVALSLAVLVAACGGGSGGGGGGGDADYGKIIAEIQLVFGTPMIGGAAEGDTITVTVDSLVSPLSAQLFMCSNIVSILEKYEATSATVIVANQAGEELSRSTDCR